MLLIESQDTESHVLLLNRKSIAYGSKVKDLITRRVQVWSVQSNCLSNVRDRHTYTHIYTHPVLWPTWRDKLSQLSTIYCNTAQSTIRITTDWRNRIPWLVLQSPPVRRYNGMDCCSYNGQVKSWFPFHFELDTLLNNNIIIIASHEDEMNDKYNDK